MVFKELSLLLSINGLDSLLDILIIVCDNRNKNVQTNDVYNVCSHNVHEKLGEGFNIVPISILSEHDLISLKCDLENVLVCCIDNILADGDDTNKHIQHK